MMQNIKNRYVHVKHVKNVKFEKNCILNISYICLINNFENCRIFEVKLHRKTDADLMTFGRIRAGGRFRFRAII